MIVDPSISSTSFAAPVIRARLRTEACDSVLRDIERKRLFEQSKRVSDMLQTSKANCFRIAVSLEARHAAWYALYAISPSQRPVHAVCERLRRKSLEMLACAARLW